MKFALKSKESQRLCVHKTSKIEIPQGIPNNSDFLQNWFSQEIRSPSLILEIWRLWEKYSWIMQNALKSNEWWRIWVFKTFNNGNTERGDQIIQTFSRIDSPKKLGRISLIWRNFKTLRKYSSAIQNGLKSNE